MQWANATIAVFCNQLFTIIKLTYSILQCTILMVLLIFKNKLKMSMNVGFVLRQNRDKMIKTKWPNDMREIIMDHAPYYHQTYR